MRQLPGTLLLYAVCANHLLPQEPSNTVPALTADAVKAYRAKDYSQFLTLEKRALSLDPANARIAYNAACGEALQGNAIEAVRILNQLLARKLDMGAQTDDDFAKIRTTKDWNQFLANLAALRAPLVHSSVAFRLADPALMTTGIAVDEATGDTYLASVRERKIVRRTKAGVVSDFITQAQDGFLAGASLAIDAPRRLIYASTAAAPFMLGYQKEDSGKSAVFVFDLKSGKLVRKAFLTTDGKQHYLNALLLDRGGNLYVSDSAVAGIYRLKVGGAELERFAVPEVVQSTQGMVFSDDEKTLFIADYANGLWALDISSNTARKIDPPAGAWLAGLDGLTRVPDGFIAVQIGVQPNRVLRLRMDSQWQHLAGVEILEMNHPDYGGPIQGVVADHSFLYVANSQLALGNGETGGFASEQAKPTVVLRLPL